MSSNFQGQTGPKSLAGKKISSMNALKTGIFAKTAVLPFEDDRQYKKHCQQVRRSLAPENTIEIALVQQIADSLWKGTRYELRSAVKRDDILSQLTPQQMAGFLGIEGKRQDNAPDFLVRPNYQFPKKELVIPKKCLQQYNHLLKNAKGVVNYQMHWRNYKELFIELSHWIEKKDMVSLFMNHGEGLNIAWQQRPREIENQLEHLTDQLWYMVNLDRFRPDIRTWMASWYFLKGRDANHLMQADEMVLKEQRHCQSLLDTYCKLRKSRQDHILFTRKYLEIEPPSTVSSVVSEVIKAVISPNLGNDILENEIAEEVVETSS